MQWAAAHMACGLCTLSARPLRRITLPLFTPSCPPPPCPQRYVNFFPEAPACLSEEQLRRLAAPTFVALSEHDIFVGDGEAAAQHARRVLPDCEVEVIKGARHVPSAQRWNAMMVRLLAFLEQRGLATLAEE